MAMSAMIARGRVRRDAHVRPPAALADGDPASDVLLGQSVFYPYSPPVAAGLQKT